MAKAASAKPGALAAAAVAMCRKCELVKDDQRDRFGPGQQAAQRIGVAPERVIEAFAVREGVTRGVLANPGPVGLDGRAVEVAQRG